MNLLELHHISKSFDGINILDNVSLVISAGSRTAIVGPSGSGKTTLLRLIAGFEMPDSGGIIMQGNPLVDSSIRVPAHRRGIGFVPQDGALFPHLTVAGNVGFALSGGRKRTQQRVDELLDMVALDRRLSTLMPHELSGGQQQRVALARALSQQPKLMLLDEPFSALDTGLRSSTRQAVSALLSKANVATILVTHDQTEALSFADQMAVLHNGRLDQTGAPQDVYLHPANEFAALFLGEALIIDAQIGNGCAHCHFGRIAVEGYYPRGPARVMLRPEQIQITPVVAQHALTGECRAIICDIDFAGFVSTVTFRLTKDGAIRENAPVFSLKIISQPGLLPGASVNVSVTGMAHVFKDNL